MSLSHDRLGHIRIGAVGKGPGSRGSIYGKVLDMRKDEGERVEL